MSFGANPLSRIESWLEDRYSSMHHDYSPMDSRDSFRILTMHQMNVEYSSMVPEYPSMELEYSYMTAGVGAPLCAWTPD